MHVHIYIYICIYGHSPFYDPPPSFFDMYNT